MSLYLGLENTLGDGIHNFIFLGAVIVGALFCLVSFRGSVNLRHWKAAKLAKDLEMELLASDNPNHLIVAGEIHDRPSTIRYKKVKSALDHIFSGFSMKKETEAEDLLMSVECDCPLDFRVAKAESDNGASSDDRVQSALLASSGLTIETKQKDKTAYIFEQPETVQTLIDLFKDTGAKRLEVCENKVNVLIVESEDKQISSAKIAGVLEKLDKFARLLEFLAEEHQHSEN